MPQLTPDPWLFIFFSSWLIFVFFMPKKILSHKFFNPPMMKSMKSSSTNWTWPW
uniref:ATP synthase complex subunit 8 n=1 Tax=Occidozyga martensii TaxID=146711 RepID=E3T239_9NEOB|nr:ATP synthase F0 subunit 8 [Occidozyga martensii]ACZ02641.1 ATP synthase subunit 8 [Occidozyga martensii]